MGRSRYVLNFLFLCQSYNLVESTFSRNNICHIVESPADVPDKIKKLAVDIAQKAVKSLEGAGVFAVELFLTKDGQVILFHILFAPYPSIQVGAI